MKTYLALIAVLTMGANDVPAQVVRIGTVDMKKAFELYYKTQDAEAKLNEQRNSSRRDVEERADLTNRAGQELKKLDEELAGSGLSRDTRERKQQLRSQKAEEFQSMEREIREFQQSRAKQLQEQSVRTRAVIVEDINQVVADKVRAGNYDIVFDKSGASLNGTPVVMTSRDAFDFTDEVVAALNHSKAVVAHPPDSPNSRR